MGTVSRWRGRYGRSNINRTIDRYTTSKKWIAAIHLHHAFDLCEGKYQGFDQAMSRQ